MKTLVFAVCVAVAAVLFMAGNAWTAPRPEAHPSCHCRAKVSSRPYWFRSVWRASDGTPIYVKCLVARSTRCWIVSVG